jgi:hypothetical protein
MPAKNRTRQILGDPVQKAIIAADNREAYRLVTNATARGNQPVGIGSRRLLFPGFHQKSNWLGRMPASERAIRQVEARLKARMPADYEEFLRTSNGFEPVNSTGIRVFAVEEVKWLIDAEADLVEAWNLSEIQDVHRSLKESLLIGAFKRWQQLLLTPTGTTERASAHRLVHRHIRLPASKPAAKNAAARSGPRADKADGESTVLAKITAMSGPDRAMGERLHAIIKASAPALSPKVW